MMKQSRLRVPLCGVFLAAIFACPPASGVQYGSYIDSDGGIVYGYTYVQLDYTELWEYYADFLFCESALYDPNGANLDSAYSETNTEQDDFVEADVSGVNGSGEYSVNGDGNVTYLADGYVDLGESYASMEFSDGGGGGCGAPPDTDTSVYQGLRAGYNWVARFHAYATLGSAGGYPQGTWAGWSGTEQWNGGDQYSSCSDGAYLPIVMSGNNFVFGIDTDYYDSIGPPDSAVAAEVSGGWPIVPCGASVYQLMWIQCPNDFTWYPYYTIALEFEVWPENFNDYVYDQRGDAHVYYQD